MQRVIWPKLTKSQHCTTQKKCLHIAINFSHHHEVCCVAPAEMLQFAPAPQKKGFRSLFHADASHKPTLSNFLFAEITFPRKCVRTPKSATPTAGDRPKLFRTECNIVKFYRLPQNGLLAVGLRSGN